MKIFTFLIVLVTLFSTMNLSAQQNSILFITDELMADSEGNIALDQPIIDELSNDYDVTVTYTPFDYVDFNNYGMVMIGRAVNSGEFQDYLAWADVQVPVLVCSVWLMRNNRLMFFNSTEAKKMAEGSIYDGMHTPVTVIDDTDPAFEGVELSDGMLEWYNGFYDYYNIGYETFADVNNGTPLAYIAADDITPDAVGKVVMARWEAGVETYEGSGNFPAALRSYVQFGADDNQAADIRLYNYSNYTDASLQVIKNEVAYLLSTSINYVKTAVEAPALAKQIEMYNSSNNELIVDLSRYEGAENLNLSVINISGQVVYQQTLEANKSRNVLNPALNSGIYLVNLRGNEVSHTARIQVK